MGQKYDVMGQSYEIYNLITHPSLQINSRFIPYYKTATQLTPTGTMIGDLGIKFQQNRFMLEANATRAILNKRKLDMRENWNVTIDGIELFNVAKKNSYEFTISTPILSLTFLSKIYYVSDLEPQYHFDYKAKLIQPDLELHG